MRARQDSQQEVDLTPSWRDLANQASRAAERVDSDETGRGLAAVSAADAERVLAFGSSGGHALRVPPRLRVVARH